MPKGIGFRLPVLDQTVVRSKLTFRRGRSLQTNKTIKTLRLVSLIKAGFHGHYVQWNEWFSCLCNYPVHDLYPIILAGLIIVFQGLKLVFHCFFCTKLKDRTILSVQNQYLNNYALFWLFQMGHYIQPGTKGLSLACLKPGAKLKE
jgi:hypothetical protein